VCERRIGCLRTHRDDSLAEVGNDSQIPAERGDVGLKCAEFGVRQFPPAEKIEKAAFTRADLVEIVGAQLSVDSERTPVS
jgi:hypothetical protein